VLEHSDLDVWVSVTCVAALAARQIVLTLSNYVKFGSVSTISLTANAATHVTETLPNRFIMYSCYTSKFKKIKLVKNFNFLNTNVYG
jgi:hypothetical protein